MADGGVGRRPGGLPYPAAGGQRNPAWRLPTAARGRFPIGRRLTTCPTSPQEIFAEKCAPLVKGRRSAYTLTKARQRGCRAYWEVWDASALRSLLAVLCRSLVGSQPRDAQQRRDLWRMPPRILESWRTSAHARAMESPLFQDVLRMAETEFGVAATNSCLACHSPVAVLTGDRALRRKVSWEGITCDYCHSIRDISLGGTNPRVKVEFSQVKSGPLKDIQAPAHETVFSPLHTSSVACAPCHEYRNPLGLACADHVFRVEGQPLRKGREGLPVLPHVRGGRGCGGPQDPEIGSGQGQLAPDAGESFHSAAQ